MKKLVSCVVILAVLAAVVAGGVALLKNRGNVPVKSAVAEQPTQDVQSMIDQAVAEALAAQQQPTAVPTAIPTSVPTAEVVDIDALVASAVAEALAAQAQPTPEAPASVVETAVACDCPCLTATPEATAEVVVTTEAVAEEAAVETEKFQIGVKYTATVNMPVFTGVTYEGFGVIYTIEPDMVPAKKNTAVYGKPLQPQFALNGDLVGYRMIGMIPEVYQPQKMEYEYVQETELTIHELVAAVTVRNENGGFALRAESNKGQQPIAKLWLSEKEAEYWTICMREDGTFVVLMRTAAAVSAPKRAVVAQPSGGNGGGESHHEPGPGPEPTGPEPDPKHPPVVDPIFDDEPAPAPSNPEPNPTHPGVVDPVFD